MHITLSDKYTYCSEDQLETLQCLRARACRFSEPSADVLVQRRPACASRSDSESADIAASAIRLC